MPERKEEINRRLADLRIEPTRKVEIVEELAQHLEKRYEELIARGLSDAQASAAALYERMIVRHG